MSERLRGLFSATVSTSAATGQGLSDLQAAVLELAGAPQLAGGAHPQRRPAQALPWCRVVRYLRNCQQAWQTSPMPIMAKRRFGEPSRLCCGLASTLSKVAA